VQTVEFIDHTGPFNTGTRRRIGLNSPVRLAIGFCEGSATTQLGRVWADGKLIDMSKNTIRFYTVPADQPRRIVLPTIAAEGIIQKVSLTPERAIAVPSNINYAGWYAPSVKPGEAGLSIIDGHVSGKYADGIFKNIHKLRVGDEFSVEYGDLSKVNFQVVEVTSLPEAESLSYLLKKRDDISKQLNLITCGGKYNKQTSTYEDRVIVVSKQI
jgi:LPXTG-site transpeptidase (sortase) family protein